MTTSLGFLPAQIISVSLIWFGFYLNFNHFSILNVCLSIIIIIYGSLMVYGNMNHGFGSESEFIIYFPIITELFEKFK